MPEQVVWNPGPFRKNLERVLALNMERAMAFLEARIKTGPLGGAGGAAGIGRTQPTLTSGGRLFGLDPSLPGEPPKVVSTRLRNSIVRDVRIELNTIIGLVGTNDQKARPLEFGTRKMAARPFLRRGLAFHKKEIFRRLVRR